MIRQDYLMRMIEELVKVITKILLNKKAGNYNTALNSIDDAFNTIVGLDYNIMNQLSAKDIIALFEISKDSATVNVKCIVIAKLLKEKTDLAKQNGDDNSTLVYGYQKAMTLYLHGILNYKNVEIDLDSYYSDVKEIAKNIFDEIPDDTRISLFKFYELIGELDKAEDELFKLKNLNYPNIEEEGMLFFRNLEKLSDIELLKGNLSKEEVEQGVVDFNK
jgi:Family of unknown function (DUF6483)